MAAAVAGAIWLGALAGTAFPTGVSLAVLSAGLLGSALLRQPKLALLALVGVGMFSGGAADSRVEATLNATVPQGRGTLVGIALSDADPYGTSHRFVIRPDAWAIRDSEPIAWSGPALAVIAQDGGVTAGDRVVVTGLLRALPGLVRGDPVAGRVTATQVQRISSTDSTLMLVGNMVRNRVRSQLSILSGSPEAALLAGFLIGDIAELPRSDNESLRRAGLTHFVAVSGSNVALVLAAWWLVLGPTGAGNRARAVTGLAVLAVFVVATRWESSVIRAATMASMVLGGRALGVPIDAWTALGGAVSILLATSGGLAYDIGFQLSVAATAGVLLGFRGFTDRRPKLFWAALGATISAQMAVVPLLLIHFGTVPLLSPVANLVAAPLVTVATGLAGLGVIIGWAVPVHLAEQVSGVVLRVARIAGEWPQLDLAASATVAVVLVSVWRTKLRWIVVVMGAVGALWMALPPGPPEVPTIVFLDVGQGDAVLLRDPSGAVVLVDGGRDPSVLSSGLRRYGVDRIDLVVATHGDADHVGGLLGLFAQVDVGHLWISDHMDPGDLLAEVIADATAAGVAVSVVAAGSQAQLGEFGLDVLGPRRRYAEGNDGSVVLWVTVRGRTVLLPGDIGAIAQRELPDLRPDLLMVPHHGSATTDLDWLATTVGDVAVISVGTNTYGHPDPDILATLHTGGVVPMLTLTEGDVVMPFR